MLRFPISGTVLVLRCLLHTQKQMVYPVLQVWVESCIKDQSYRSE